jgi:hypothetical protein
MYTARLMIVFLVIVALIFANDPITREQMSEGWEQARPGVVAFMDGMYAMVRTLINGDGQGDWIDDYPVHPDVDFDRIVTMDKALFFE